MSEKRSDRVRGPGHDTFWEHCAADELWLQRCAGCGKITWPVEPACEHCGSTALAFERMAGTGTVVSRCQFHQDYYRAAPPVPHDCILVELDEGVLFMSEPKGFGYEQAQQGTRVKLAFIDCEDSAGAFRLPVFELA